jgi:hypothetical protein
VEAVQGPAVIDKVRDVVGLYLNPPERAVVLCVDEKSQIQALDRTAPILPMLPGVPERATHDYKRAGTSSLYAALDISTGKVIVLHFTPTSSSWLNLVERWFAELTAKKLRRGAHRSVRRLNADIRAWIDTWSTDPKPFVWDQDRRRNPRLDRPPLPAN